MLKIVICGGGGDYWGNLGVDMTIILFRREGMFLVDFICKIYRKDKGNLTFFFCIRKISTGLEKS